MFFGVVGFIILGIIILVVVVLLVLAQSGITSRIPPSAIDDRLVAALSQFTVPFFCSIALTSLLLAGIFITFYLPRRIALTWIRPIVLLILLLGIANINTILYLIYSLYQSENYNRIRGPINQVIISLLLTGIVVIVIAVYAISLIRDTVLVDDINSIEGYVLL